MFSQQKNGKIKLRKFQEDKVKTWKVGEKKNNWTSPVDASSELQEFQKRKNRGNKREEIINGMIQDYVSEVRGNECPAQ